MCKNVFCIGLAGNLFFPGCRLLLSTLLLRYSKCLLGFFKRFFQNIDTFYKPQPCKHV